MHSREFSNKKQVKLADNVCSDVDPKGTLSKRFPQRFHELKDMRVFWKFEYINLLSQDGMPMEVNFYYNGKNRFSVEFCPGIFVKQNVLGRGGEYRIVVEKAMCPAVQSELATVFE